MAEANLQSEESNKSLPEQSIHQLKCLNCKYWNTPRSVNGALAGDYGPCTLIQSELNMHNAYMHLSAILSWPHYTENAADVPRLKVSAQLITHKDFGCTHYKVE